MKDEMDKEKEAQSWSWLFSKWHTWSAN